MVRNARVITAADEMHRDIGVKDRRIMQLGAGLAGGIREVDAQGRAVTPGGVDAHCHLEEISSGPVRMGGAPDGA